MNLKEFYQSKEILTVVCDYLTGNCHVDGADSSWGWKEIFRKSAENLSATHCVIPVLGTQGSGKSSFLNALLFDDVVLPVDADETTCIPTEVRYGENEKPTATVVFQDGKEKTVVCTEDALNEYVHQRKNPGNTKGVSCIRIMVKSELLKSGIVLVDLPGVGSITASNQRTTMDYLKVSTAAIFMLRTVPPITGSESCFIQGALPFIGHVFWVQNQWTDESEDEVKDGKDHNYKTLCNIARKAGLPHEYVSEPFVVCVYRALKGKVSDDRRLIDSSHVQEFVEKIVEFSSHWRKSIEQNGVSQAKEILKNTLAAAESKKNQLSGDVETELKKARELRKGLEDQNEANRALVGQALKALRAQKSDLENVVCSEIRRSAENLRNAVRESIANGIVGGKELERAFGDHVDEENLRLYETIQPQIFAFAKTFNDQLLGLKECRLNHVDVEVEASFESQTKIHDQYGRILGAGGAIGAGFGGAKIGASVGAFVGGPVGAVIGGIAGGLLGALFGGWVGGKGGHKLHEVHLEAQKASAESELRKYITKYQSETAMQYSEAVGCFVKDLENSINNWVSDQEASIENQYKSAKADLERPVGERKALLRKVDEDIVRIHGWMKEVA